MIGVSVCSACIIGKGVIGLLQSDYRRRIVIGLIDHVIHVVRNNVLLVDNRRIRHDLVAIDIAMRRIV